MVETHAFKEASNTYPTMGGEAKCGYWVRGEQIAEAPTCERCMTVHWNRFRGRKSYVNA